MLDYISQVLKERTDITAWQVTKTTRRSNQLFLIKEEPESIRRVDTVKYFVAVHQLRNEGGKSVLGESSFVFIEGEDIGPKVDLAVEMAKGVANQPWTLPGPGQKYLPCEIKDTTIVLNPDKMIQKIKEEIVGAVERLGDVRLSSAEVFADHTRYELVNSLGLTAKADDTDMLFDFVLMTGEGEHEVESSGFKTVRYYKDLKVAE
ncbi:MAG TPA: hypothetical protein VGK71_00460, partial [Nitrospirota bacterium]